ncbi:unnamed protein product [Symbiodinium natans]|uniref:Uncharacterized protein n=1 Tax=Symbiodinium natans TaxID=878477 RepID=A0A812NHX7_9DINO|nr:unnamed protein product [Symbiodinium natans]
MGGSKGRGRGPFWREQRQRMAEGKSWAFQWETTSRKKHPSLRRRLLMAPALRPNRRRRHGRLPPRRLLGETVGVLLSLVWSCAQWTEALHRPPLREGGGLRQQGVDLRSVPRDSTRSPPPGRRSEEARSSRDLPNQHARPRSPSEARARPPVDPAHEAEESPWGRRQRMRREAPDFTPGVHAAGEAASYKRPTSPRHFLPQELTLTWDPIRQVVVEARVLPRLGWGQSRVGYQLSQALVLKLTDDASLNGPEIDMARRFPRLLAPILTSGSMWIGLGPEGVPGAGLHRFLYHVQEHRCQAREWLQENAANGLRVHSYLLATLATLLHLYACGVDAKDVGISNLSHRPLGTRLVPLPAFIDANNWGQGGRNGRAFGG